MSRIKQNFLLVGGGLFATYGMMKIVAHRGSESPEIDDDNPYIHTDEERVDVHRGKGTYEAKVKQLLDQILSFFGLIILSPAYAIIAIAIKIDDPGSVFFTQKRVGLNKHFFFCHKFRSMKMSTPHDVPTHQMTDPEQYITKVGAVLRRTSLDELPQIWDIFRGRMSVIGPRPALWNQEDLVLARAGCYNITVTDVNGGTADANCVMPGLTGLAQTKGRDELEIPEKAAIDREYAAVLRSGGLRAFAQDCGCFFDTMKSVLKHDGIVEGGTGKLHKNRS